MKISKQITVLCLILVALLIAAAGVMLWFYSTGIHFLFNVVHLDISENFYIVNSDNEIIGEEILSVKGTVKKLPNEGGVLSKKGVIEINSAGYFPDITLDDSASVYFIELNNDVIEVSITTTASLVEDEAGIVRHGPAIYYKVLIDRNSSEILMCKASIPDENGHIDYDLISTNDISVINSINQRAYAN